ncbi:MAG: hypothetical protein Q4C96_01075 [Planctomycetia bacterium]|nr:hypothetical protein [Planctomycetia bacterium]
MTTIFVSPVWHLAGETNFRYVGHLLTTRTRLPEKRNFGKKYIMCWV